jgi:hypothetical protein
MLQDWAIGTDCSLERSTSILPPPVHLFALCDQGGALALIGHCGHQRKWCSTYKSENPGDAIDSNLSLRPLEVQPSLRGANECLSFCIIHKPVRPPPMPPRFGTYLTPEINEHLVRGESNGWHSQSPNWRSNRTVSGNHCATPKHPAAVNRELIAAEQIRHALGLLTNGGAAAGDQQHTDGASAQQSTGHRRGK